MLRKLKWVTLISQLESFRAMDGRGLLDKLPRAIGVRRQPCVCPSWKVGWGAEVRDTRHPPSVLDPRVQLPTSQAELSQTRLQNTPLTNCTVFMQKEHSLWGPQVKESLNTHPAGHSRLQVRRLLAFILYNTLSALVQFLIFSFPRSRSRNSTSLSNSLFSMLTSARLGPDVGPWTT